MIGHAVNRLIGREDLPREEMTSLFRAVMEEQGSGMDRGAFLAALTAKGATVEELCAIRDVIYELDTVKVFPRTERPVCENSGTGMDRFKTFNISTAAAVTAASCGAAAARHCSRGITSKCGAVDVAEALGADMEAEPEKIRESIEDCGIGIFNGMSSKIHPSGTARILNSISFGTVLNTAASLAGPVVPEYGVRGINDPSKLEETARLMRLIGYRKGMVLHGYAGDLPAMDECSTIGRTDYVLFDENGISTVKSFTPEDMGYARPADPEVLRSTGDPKKEALRLVRILSGADKGPCRDIVCLNAGMILFVTGLSEDMYKACRDAEQAIDDKRALGTLKEWVCTQTSMGRETASERFEKLVKEALG